MYPFEQTDSVQDPYLVNCPRVSNSSTRVSSDKVEDPIMVDEEVISDMVGVGGSCRTELYLTPDGVLVFLGDADLRHCRTFIFLG